MFPPAHQPSHLFTISIVEQIKPDAVLLKCHLMQVTFTSHNAKVDRFKKNMKAKTSK